jgi:hypothetical protein
MRNGIAAGIYEGYGATRLLACFFILLLSAFPAFGQARQWTTETVDADGISMSMVTDKAGNVHMSYLFNGGIVKYAFRPAHSAQWFTMEIPGTQAEGHNTMPTRMGLDPDGNPHVCFTPGVLKYASFDGKQWSVQQIDPGSGLIEFTCSFGFAPDGTPHIIWYQYGAPGGSNYLHLKHAFLQKGVWLARTVDFENQTGKWNSMTMDAQGRPHITYDSFIKGELKYGSWDGKEWKISVVDSREFNANETAGAGAYNRGMGNTGVVNRDGKGQVSYEYLDAALYAWQTDTGWKIDTIDHISTSGSWLGYRTRQVLGPDGNPYVVYEDGGSVKLAFWDGSRWHKQTVVPAAFDRHRFSDIAIDQEGTIFVAYRDGTDGSVKVTVGRLQTQPQSRQGQDSPKSSQ